jgi:hypothetical protein
MTCDNIKIFDTLLTDRDCDMLNESDTLANTCADNFSRGCTMVTSLLLVTGPYPKGLQYCIITELHAETCKKKKFPS